MDYMMILKKEAIINEIKRVRKEIGHEDSEINIEEIKFNETNKELWIITSDRPDKSAVIGKGGWVVGRLKEDLNLNKIHVETYMDFIQTKHKLKLSLNKITKELDKLNKRDQIYLPLNNLKTIITKRIDNTYELNLKEEILNLEINENTDYNLVLGLSGGVDSSFSLILAKYLGFNPIAISIDPGTIILPNQFKKNINQLTKELNIKQEYIEVDYTEIINNSLKGKYHPCGRCSKVIEETIYNYSAKHNIPIVAFGDMLSTGSNSITYKKIEEKTLLRLNLPASLSISKEEIKNIIKPYNIKEIDGFGCPLLYEVHKKYPHMKKYSIQRILRENHSGALKPGQALDLIWSFYKTK